MAETFLYGLTSDYDIYLGITYLILHIITYSILVSTWTSKRKLYYIRKLLRGCKSMNESCNCNPLTTYTRYLDP